jgi:XapX domain-containing protein
VIKTCAIFLVVGLLVGLVYHVLRVHSPAPPLAALVGLLGMLAGEHLVPMTQAALTRVAPPIGTRTPTPRSGGRKRGSVASG